MKLNDIYFKCEKCKESFLLNVNNIMSRKPVTIDNDVYFVTFVKCSNCGKKHAVQIDNKETLDLLMEYEKLFVRLSMLRKKGKSISKKDNEKLKEINNEIKVKRFYLAQNANNKTMKNLEGSTSPEDTFKLCVLK